MRLRIPIGSYCYEAPAHAALEKGAKDVIEKDPRLTNDLKLC